MNGPQSINTKGLVSFQETEKLIFYRISTTGEFRSSSNAKEFKLLKKISSDQTKVQIQVRGCTINRGNKQESRNNRGCGNLWSMHRYENSLI
jgi:hypothetical protein